MASNQTEAWVLRRGARGESERGKLELATIELPPLEDEELLVEPLYGCWEANMMHALQRDPVDVCRLRREQEVVLGNAGVVRVVEKGAKATVCDIGDVCVLVPIGTSDQIGHTVRVFGYDAPHTIGMLAKRTILNQNQVTPLPKPTRHKYQQWAGFPIRYATAWENWILSYGIWKLQFAGEELPPTHIWGWGGGVSLAQLELAQHFDCQTAMIASTDKRLAQIAERGITPIDRREFADLEYDEEKFNTDRRWRANYLKAEGVFLDLVEQHTGGDGVSIFVENIGLPVFRATLRALGRMGIVTTAGWREGKELTFDRATQCITRHVFVHTHGCRRETGVDAVAFGEEHGWLPPPGAEQYAWEDVPQLAADYEAGKIESYFPVFEVNPE